MSEEGVGIDGPLGTLRGILHAPQGVDTGWSAVFVQGYFSSTHVGPARLYVLLARTLAAMGIETLRIDPYGVGDSDGDFARSSYASEMADYRSAIDWILGRGSPRRLVLIGHCLGAGMSIRLAASDGRVERVLVFSPAFGPVTHFERLFGEAHRGELARDGRTIRKATFISGRFLDALQAQDLFEVATRVEAELTVFYGSADQYLDRSGSERVVDAVPGARLVDIEGGDHNFVATGARDTFRVAFEAELRRLWQAS